VAEQKGVGGCRTSWQRLTASTAGPLHSACDTLNSGVQIILNNMLITLHCYFLWSSKGAESGTMLHATVSCL